MAGSRKAREDDSPAARANLPGSRPAERARPTASGTREEAVPETVQKSTMAMTVARDTRDREGPERGGPRQRDNAPGQPRDRTGIHQARPQSQPSSRQEEYVPPGVSL